MLKNLLTSGKFHAFLGGAVVAIVAPKVLKSEKTRAFCVKGLAAGMKLQKDAAEAFENIKEEAADICLDASKEAESRE